MSLSFHKRMSLSSLGECGLINRVTRPVSDQKVIVGIGDDCAVLKYNRTHYELLTTDTLVEGDHFKREWFTAFQVGRKAVVSNVSDILAMGGFPKYMLISLSLPLTTTIHWVEELYKGIYGQCDTYNIKLIGGNTTHGEKIVITITLVGYVQKNNLRLRSAAKVGDYIGVTGFLGGSAAGLAVLKANIPGYVESYVEPMTVSPRLAHTITPFVHAMIDVSDGLASEVGHICEASMVGAVVYKDKIPLADTTKEDARALQRDPIEFALYGGEDYQLVFTVAPNRVKYLKHFKGCYFVGEIVDKKERMWLVDNGKKTPLGSGYVHFKKQN